MSSCGSLVPLQVRDYALMTTLQRLGITIPIVQAPMAGISTPTMAAAVSMREGLV